MRYKKRNEMKEKLQKFLNLVAENPDLQVVPMVDGEICGDDYACYMGEWGDAYIDEYIMCSGWAFGGAILFKSLDDMEDVFEKYLTHEEYEKLPEDEFQRTEIYNNLPWKKAIIVNINQPPEE